ncbi:MAG: TonB-dependent receptor [Burkholderiales bacterium]|nr:TonB-dependent receptor [Burkholderiales bacterium]
MKPIFRLRALAAVILPFFSPGGGTAFAQDTSTLKEVTVTGNPLGATDLVAPAVQYSGPALLLRSQTTLGETLSGTPGVSSSYFGPNASRPVIRGQDGDRIRILSNSGASVDASGLSFDHAVTADPISIERVEVLRGAGALQYGGSAVGGVVNVIDNRIPREPSPGFNGKADLGLASANRERGAGLLLEGGTERFGLHADVFDRRTQDVRVPASLACTQAGVTRFASRICNSASHVDGGAMGGSLFWDDGYLGASAGTYRNRYGTVAEDEVTINMRSNRYALEGEVRKLGGALQSIKGQLSRTDYQHTEFEAGAPGTVFSNKGTDWRLEARHAKLGALDGVIGLQGESNRFSADGSEAFAPYSRTRSNALFATEELATSWGKLTFGARAESVKVESFGNPAIARFVPASRSFTPGSVAAGALWNVAPQWQLTGNLAATQRAPKDYELFADGPHVATGAWELGNPLLQKEKSTNLDLGLQWKSGPHNAKASVFSNRFDNYVSLEATGNTRGPDALPEFAYRQVRARFSGAEAGGTVRLLDAGQTLDVELRGDLVRADNLDTGQPLPRIAPVRAGATLAWARGAWGARLGFDRAAAQTRVPAGDRATGGYTLWNAAVTWRTKAAGADLLWYARLDNAGDRLAYSASSILTQTAPGKAPLPGRSFKLGLQAAF